MRVEPQFDIFIQSGLERLRHEGLTATMGRSASGIRSVLVQRGRHMIETSPTTEDWSGFYRKNPRWEATVRASTGRVETGQMRDDFKSYQRVNGDSIDIFVGWDYDPGYYHDQEWGFTWEPPPSAGPDAGYAIDVPGMYVLQRLWPQMDKMIIDSLTRHVNKYFESYGE